MIDSYSAGVIGLNASLQRTSTIFIYKGLD